MIVDLSDENLSVIEYVLCRMPASHVRAAGMVAAAALADFRKVRAATADDATNPTLTRCPTCGRDGVQLEPDPNCPTCEGTGEAVVFPDESVTYPGPTKDELIERLKEYAASGDPEGAHVLADHELLAFINDVEVRSAYNAVTKWYGEERPDHD